MKVKFSYICLILTLNNLNVLAAIAPNPMKDILLQKYLNNYETKIQLSELKKATLAGGGKSVDALIEVMKNGKYPDKNRWIATFMLGEIMGKKSSPFIVKFLRHPSWVMRMASLKTLLALKENRYGVQYSMLLSDDSLLVRQQALENIKQLNLTKFAPNVWAMLYDKKNYAQPVLNGKKLKNKRTHIIKEIIETVGELKFEQAKPVLIKMIQKDRYGDIFPEIDSALSKIDGKKSPDSDTKLKRIYWQRRALDSTIE